LRRLLPVLLVLFILLLPVAVLATDVTIIAIPNYVGVLLVTCSLAQNITATSAVLVGNITHTGGDNATMRGFEWGYSTGNYTLSWNETGNFTTGVFYHEITGLTPDTEVFWRAFAENVYGQGNSSECSFLAGSGLPLAPTNFTATQISADSANLTWVMGVSADGVIIRGSESGYPASITDGYLVYNGTGTEVTVEGLALSTNAYSYSAWSWNSYGYSLDYAQAQIGGDTFMVAIFIAIALFLMWMAWRTRDLLICITSSLIWFAISLWIFFSNANIFDLSESYVKILAYVFFIIAFIPLIWSMNQEIKHEAKGKSWVTYGSPPEEEKPPSKTDQMRGEIKRRLR